MTKKILIVDDSASMRTVVFMALRGQGYEVLEACDGNDALSKLKEHKINLIISDVNMPNMDGITFVKHVKAQPEHKFTPIIMLTTEGQDSTKEEGRAAGVKAWVMKPFLPAQLLGAVSRLIGA